MHSILEWKVDVISLSLGFDRGNSRIDAALREADRRDILVFAAVSNYGAAALRQIAWPASMTKVFGINSANFDGVTSSFNPPENDNDTFSRYKFLGEGVRSAWPLHKGEGEEKILSGTSMAAPIAGATASLFIEFMRQNSQDDEAAADAKIMETPDGMREIFHSIGNAKSKGDFFKYVTPWHLLHSDGGASVKIDRRYTLGRIREVLRGLRIENSEGHDTSTDASGEPGALFSNETTRTAAQFSFPGPIANPGGRRIPYNMTEQRESEETWGTQTGANNSRRQDGQIRAQYLERLLVQPGPNTLPHRLPNPSMAPSVMGYIPSFPPPQIGIPQRAQRPHSNLQPQYFSPQNHESQRKSQGEGADNVRKGSGFRRRSHNKVSTDRNPSTNVRPHADLTAENLKAKDRLEIAETEAKRKRFYAMHFQSKGVTPVNGQEISLTGANSAAEDDTDEEDDSEEVTIKITGGARVMVGGSEIRCEDGGEIAIRRRKTEDTRVDLTSM